MGGKRMDMTRIHIYMNSAVSRETGCRDGHAKETGSVTSGLVTAQQMSDFPESLFIITGCVGVFKTISVMVGYRGGHISMMGLADSTILLGDGVGWRRNGVAVRCFQNLRTFLDESITGFWGQ